MTENQTTNSEVNSATPPPAEKLLPQSEVNSLVGAAKQKAREQGRQEAMQEIQQQQMQQQQQPAMSNQNVQQPANPNPMPSNPDDFRRIAAEEFAKQQQALLQAHAYQQQQAEGQRIYSELQAKFEAAKATNPDIDFNKTMNEFQNMAGVLKLANTFDNTPDVIQHLRENPGKALQINMLLSTAPEHFASKEMKKIADSITQNQAALASQKSPEPLSQIRPSNLGVGNSGSESYHTKYKGMF